MTAYKNVEDARARSVAGRSGSIMDGTPMAVQVQAYFMIDGLSPHVKE